ncbi:glycosyltransferase family 4 protein [Curvivirga sp.]|uniref:glycosyltransferase family 4 protein n=1 Tax=Curvivirga sp. TaxID=2856848 RepID=UPI003B59790D
MTIAFYAPLKSPNHPTPSGDRRVGRLILQALKMSGEKVELASEFRSYNKTGDNEIQDSLEQEAAAEMQRLITLYEKNGAPEVWFTYHLYHKAPDLIGPKICKHFHIPYCIAEASYAPKQESGPWDRGLKATQEALALAGRIYVLNPDDVPCIKPYLPSWTELILLPPFLDARPYQSNLDQLDRGKWAEKLDLPEDDIWAIAVGMMRKGDKTQSYEIIADSWKKLGENACSLILVGDGESRKDLEEKFANLHVPVRFTGQMDENEIADLLQNCDLCIWPGIKEAFGLAMLEAQAAGLPVVSANRAGIANFIHHRQTGLLVEEGNVDAFSEAVDYLLEHEDIRHNMSFAAEENVKYNHSLQAAAQIIARSLPL